MALALAAALALSPRILLAQDAGASSDADPAPGGDDAASAEGQVTELGKVTVTAAKRVENINRVPAAISVIDGDRIRKFGATELVDYAHFVPGLHLTSGGTPGQVSLALRGIAVLSPGATVGTYIGEVPVGSSGMYQLASVLALDLLPYDVDRVEVLRGPQGTLYGAGSMGGLLKYVLREPDLHDREFRAGFGVSSVHGGGHGGDVRFGANLPLVAGRLGLRLSHARHGIPGFVDNPVTGARDINDGRQLGTRATLSWQGERTQLQLTAIHQAIDSDDNATVSLEPGSRAPVGGGLGRRLRLHEPFGSAIDFLAATLDRSLGWADFTSATGYTDTATSHRADTSVQYGALANLLLGLPAPGSAFLDVDLAMKKFTQEFRLASRPGAFEWMLGAYYTHEEGIQDQHAGLLRLDGSPLPASHDSIAGTLATLALPSEYTEKAAFANASYQPGGRFRLGAGLRHARNDQAFSQDVTAGILLPLGQSSNRSREAVTTWSVSPQFQLGDDAMLYAKVATGYQPGGPNVIGRGLPPQVDSSMLTSHEVGMKGLFADNRLQVDMAAFHIDWEDIQVPTVANGLGGLVNAGATTSNGIELALVYQPTTSLQLGLNASYNDASLDKDYPPLVVPAGTEVQELTMGMAGDAMPYVPRYTWSATAEYFFDAGGDWVGNAGAALRAVDARVNGTRRRTVVRSSGSPTMVLFDRTDTPLQLDAYQSLDLFAGVSNEHWAIRGFLKNVTDERAYTRMDIISSEVTGVVDGIAATPIPPRTLGIQLDYTF